MKVLILHRVPSYLSYNVFQQLCLDELTQLITDIFYLHFTFYPL